MQSKGNSPNAAQKAWREDLRRQGCVYGYPGLVQIHHPLGTTARHMHTDIGHWLIIPASERAHREIERLPKREQVELFLQDVLGPYVARYGECPIPKYTVVAIASWRK